MTISFSPYHLSNSAQTIIHTLPLRRYTATSCKILSLSPSPSYSSPRTAVSRSTSTVCDCHSGSGIQYRYQSLQLSIPPCSVLWLVDTSSSGLSPSLIVSILCVSSWVKPVSSALISFLIFLGNGFFLYTKIWCANHPFIYVLYSAFRY